MSQDNVANMIANLAHIQASNKAEAIALLADAITILGTRSEDNISHSVVGPRPTTESPQAHESAPPTPKPKNTVLCRVGSTCSCARCGRDVYKVSRDITDGMGAEEFAGGFSPIGDAPALSVPLAVQFIDDSALMDCPVCKEELSLVLWGSGRQAKSRTNTDVVALGADDLGDIL